MTGFGLVAFIAGDGKAASCCSGNLSDIGGSGNVNLVRVTLWYTEAEWGGVGCDVTITAGELGVDELQLDVFDDESG